MFWTIIRPSPGASSSKLYHAFGTFVQASLAAARLARTGLASVITQTQPVPSYIHATARLAARTTNVLYGL